MERKDFLRLPLNNKNSTFVSGSENKDAMLKIDELEKTVRFLKEEQKRMLCNLHQEIASLQSKNRDLLCQLIFSGDCDFDYGNSISDSDVKYILTSHENLKKPMLSSSFDSKARDSCTDDVYELKYTIDQQQREIEYLKGQMELVSLRNSCRNRESRQMDTYIREMEEKNRDQDKLIRLLRKENKEQKSEVENLRKTLSSVRINSHLAQNVQITHVQPQTQLFPTVGTPSNFWCQNRTIPITEYPQLQRNSISATGSDRTTNNLSNVQFTLPPVCTNYRQIAVTAPPPRFYSNTNYYYSIAQRPMRRCKSYATENGVRSPNKNVTNSSNI